MEIWDAYNEDGSLANLHLVRGQEIPKELFHIVVDILVVHTDGSVLLMQRDFNKEGYAGKYEASAGGSILKGETSEEGAIRELREETGVNAETLNYISRYIDNKRNTIYDQYICITNCQKDSITLQEEETISYRWISKDEFLKFIDSDEYIDSHKVRLLRVLKMIQLII